MTDDNKNMPFGITREEILELAAQKVADQCMSEDNIYDRATSIMKARIEELFQKRVIPEMTTFLQAEMEKLVATKITATNIWGETVGPETTLRDALVGRARIFWEEKVDKEGRPSAYGGMPRHEWMTRTVVGQEFEKAVKENAEAIVKAFKQALQANCAQMVAEHVTKLIKI